MGLPPEYNFQTTNLGSKYLVGQKKTQTLITEDPVGFSKRL